MKYTVVLVAGEEPGVYVAYVPVLGITTQGNSLEHALAMAREASELVVEDLGASGEDVLTEQAGGTVIASIDVKVPVAVTA